MRLFHFSDDPTIASFSPRPVRVPSPRPPGREWLNGPLVWAIDERHQPMYLFPRDCPRILLWPTPFSTLEDQQRWDLDGPWRMAAYVEDAWLAAIETAVIYRYELPAVDFECLDDAGMWISRRSIEPLGMEPIDDLAGALAAAGVQVRPLPTLAPLRDVWENTLHASGLRLRNARGWRQT